MKPSSIVHKIGPYNYLPDDLLGQGSSGKVYLGTAATIQKVAIKIINMQEINNEVTRYLLQCEKQALMGINHQHILKALDIYQEQQLCYIITPYCEGGSLKEFILKRRTLPETEALTLFRKLLLAYNAIKGAHFLHRDLKSSNVMLKNLQPVIIDFGYCQKTYGQKPRVFYNVGSPSYMPPEAFYKSLYSEKSDIWSLGIILFEMLTGHTIDRGQPIHRYFSYLIKHGYKLPKHISKDCEEVLEACLKINPQHRSNTSTLLSMVDKYFQKQEEKSVCGQNIESGKKILKNMTSQKQNLKHAGSLNNSLTNLPKQQENKQPSTCHTIGNQLEHCLSMNINPRKNLHTAKMAESFIHNEVSQPPQPDRTRITQSLHLGMNSTVHGHKPGKMSMVQPSTTAPINTKPKVYFQCVSPNPSHQFGFVKKSIIMTPHRPTLTINHSHIIPRT